MFRPSPASGSHRLFSEAHLSGSFSAPKGERLESPGLAPILALPRTQWESWASPVPSSFSLCKLGAGVAGEEVSEDSFQDPVEGENPNSADC